MAARATDLRPSHGAVVAPSTGAAGDSDGVNVIAAVQVAPSVRRPVASDTFLAVDAHEDGQVLRMRGSWRGSVEERSYTLPVSSLVAVRWLREDAA